MSVSLSGFFSLIHRSHWHLIIAGKVWGRPSVRRQHWDCFLPFSDSSASLISTLGALAPWCIGLLPNSYTNQISYRRTLVPHIQLCTAQKDHCEHPAQFPLHPPTLSNICKPFPLNSTGWPSPPSHLYCFSSLQMFSIWGHRHILPYSNRKLFAESQALLSRKKLGIWDLWTADQFSLMPDGRWEHLGCFLQSLLCRAQRDWDIGKGWKIVRFTSELLGADMPIFIHMAICRRLSIARNTSNQ